MDSVFTNMSTGDSLPLASLRLLVPPLQLMTASMWQVLKKQDVMSYWEVAEFVSLVVDMVPELLLYKHRTQLNLGLRARYVLELCRSEQPVKPELILSYLDMIRSPNPALVKEPDEEMVKVSFFELIHYLLKDPEERRDFFQDVFPSEFGRQYDSDLQTLFSEFLCRLTQVLPVPDLEQTVSWLGATSSLLEDCVQTVSDPTDLKTLLQHHKSLGHLEQHVPPASMGDSILSSLSAFSPQKMVKRIEQEQSDHTESIGPVTLVDDDVVEIITVSDYAEVEVSATDIEVTENENCFEGVNTDAPAEDSLETFFEEKTGEEEEAAPCSASSQQEVTTGRHDCPDCGKKFKFASSLLAHSVIHTGERPHCCSDCNRRFSFRQSLDRHRHTHKIGRTYDCVVCGETFHSLSARTEHKQTHMDDGVYRCSQCNRRFSWELSFAKHLKSHTEDGPREGLDILKTANNMSEAVVGPSEPDFQVQESDGGDNCPLKGECQQQGGPAAERDKDTFPPVKVRTSGRKRRPTMKVQMINLQKGIATKQREELNMVNLPAPKPFPFISSEHSYGSLVSKDGAESSPADSSSVAFSCPQCPFQHSEELQVLQHVNEFHPVEDSSSPEPVADEVHYQCTDCKKRFPFRSLLKAHRRIHTGEQPFSCAQCGRRFSFKQSLERHKQTHKSGQKYKCLICGQLFKSAAEESEHDSTHVENGEYLCSECSQTFTGKSALMTHLKTHGLDNEKVENSYRCPHCDMAFSCASYLNRHLQTHKEDKVHACSCGKNFSYRAGLTAHQRIHQKERPHTCAQCGKGFLYKGGLLSHMKVHSEEAPFMCSFCGKSFKRERNMKKHERCHTRENVFSCSQCDKTFVYKATLIRHELTHSGERPYLCSDCGKGFLSHAELLKHERFHTGHKPFQCPHCGKKFTQSCYLTIHLRYHTGDRPYSCSECDKSFLSANRLKRHQRTHSGEKPYLCLECGKGFRQSYHLRVHQRTHLS